MKVLCATVLFILVIFSESESKIINGYEHNIADVIRELRFLLNLQIGEIDHLDGTEEWSNLSKTQQEIVPAKIEKLIEHLNYYQLTQELIDEFRSICPDIYSEVNNIKNHDSVSTDVYIKVLPANHQIRAVSGATMISRDVKNPHVCVSEYGRNSVSVLVCLNKIALKVLAHELGHVKFIVPNLNRYLNYCSKRYQYHEPNIVQFNHQASDMGSRTVIEYERRFKLANVKYRHSSKSVMFAPKKRLKEIRNSNSWAYLLEEFDAKHQEEM
jgi:hypothetical protein